MTFNTLKKVTKLDRHIRNYFELEIPASLVTGSIKNHYRFDSLDYVDLRIMIYGMYDVKIPVHQLKRMKSIYDLSRLIDRHQFMNIALFNRVKKAS